MGKKSDKKVKSDRVNALRKQYDAFLEEDKKRKERNEYILGKLDNIRYSSTAVQIRHKPIVYGDLLPVYNRVGYRPEPFERHDIQISQHIQQMSRSNQPNLQVDLPRQYLDDTSLLKEISKKYILIPKLRPTLINDYIGTIPPQSLPTVAVSPPQTITNNEDWKSKYDILEQLKQAENEEQTIKFGQNENDPVKENQMLKDNSKKVIDSFDLESINNTKQNSLKYVHEVPEKDLSFDKVRVESESQNNSIYQEPNTYHAPKSSTSIHISPELNTVYDYTLQSQGLEHAPTVESAINPTNIDENVQHNYAEEIFTATKNNTEEEYAYNVNEHQVDEDPLQENHPVEYEQLDADEGSENVYLDKDDYSPIQVVNPTELVKELRNEVPNITEKEDNEAVEYPIDMLNVQEFTPEGEVKLIDGLNVNPHYMASEKTSEPLHENNLKPADSANEETFEPLYETNPETEGEGEIKQLTIEEQQQINFGIQAFDDEHKEMFYSENTPEVAYDKQQQAVSVAYEPEFDPTQSQELAQDYTFYESPEGLQEQEYPSEINEHEETSTRYDQNYEQQYMNYEQQEYDHIEGQQQYDQPAEEYEEAPQEYQDYDYLQTNAEPIQNIEKVLDNEQTYTKVQNLKDSSENDVLTNQMAKKNAS